MPEEIRGKKITELPESTAISDEDLFAVGSAGTPSLRKTKWSTIWNKILEKIRSSIIVNNLTTQESGYAMDARQGAVINESLTELNAKIVKNTQTVLSSASGNYFGGTSYVFMVSGGAFAILLIRLNVLQAISAGNTSACLNGLPFSWKYDFTFPIMHADGTGNFLTGAVGTSSIKLTAGQVPFKTGNYYAIVPVPNIFIA